MTLLKKYCLVLTALFLSSCTNQKVIEQLNEHSLNQSNSISELTQSITASQEEHLSWKQAIAQYTHHNIEYLQSVDAVSEAAKAQRRTWWSLAPEIFTFANVSKSIIDIADLSIDDLTFSVVANLTIPNPFQFYAQLYADYLGQLSSEWNHELVRRNFRIRLYRFYLQQKQLDQNKVKLADAKKQLESNSDSNIDELLSQYQQLRVNYIANKEQLRVQLNNFFNTPGKRWKLVGTPPNISYAKRLDKLSLENGYGQLGLRLQTVAIESNILTLWNVKLSKWPQLNIGLSNPPLLNSNGTGAEYFDSEQTRLFTGTSYGIQLDDPLSKERLKNAETRAQYTRERLRLTTERDASRLHLLKMRYKYLLQQESTLKQQLKSYKSQTLTSQSPSSIASTYQKQVVIKESLRNNKLQQLQFDLELWLWDETYWSKN
ncbi:hypothetical protein ACFPK9_07015 [Rubritalea spongiae]|uniref:TolC family protein n=1 Tax=Rubritalea spongiae TaxID=430797 RepID=A0ABW5E4P2_9BACT